MDARGKVAGPLKSCPCGRTYTRAEWCALPLVGEELDEVERAELRNCAGCSSTLRVTTARVTIGYSVARVGDSWLVFRKAGPLETVALGVGHRAIFFASEEEANARVARERRADKAAATRLGIELVAADEHDEPGR